MPQAPLVTRVIRITNVRANAFQLGVSSTLIPTQISMIVSVNGNANLNLNQPANGNVVGNDSAWPDWISYDRQPTSSAIT